MRRLVVCVVICFHVAEARSKQTIKIRLDGLGNEDAFPMYSLIDEALLYRAATRAALLREAMQLTSMAAQLPSFLDVGLPLRVNIRDWELHYTPFLLLVFSARLQDPGSCCILFCYHGS